MDLRQIPDILYLNDTGISLNPILMTLFTQVVPEEELSSVWKAVMNPENDRHKAMRDLLRQAWDVYEPHAEKGFIQDIQSRHFSQRWWEMYFWVRLVELNLAPSHPGPGMPDTMGTWRGQSIYFECVSPTVGQGDNKIPEFPSGKAHSVPQDEVTLRMTTAIAAKVEQAKKRQERTGLNPYIIAIDTSQLHFSGFDEALCLRTVYPLGHATVTLFPNSNKEPVWSNQYRPEIRRGERAAIPTTGFLDGTDYKQISALIFCNSNIGNIAWGANPDLMVVHNFRTQRSLSRKIFRNNKQWAWNGYSTLCTHRPIEESPSLEEVRS